MGRQAYDFAHVHNFTVIQCSQYEIQIEIKMCYIEKNVGPIIFVWLHLCYTGAQLRFDYVDTRFKKVLLLRSIVYWENYFSVKRVAQPQALFISLYNIGFRKEWMMSLLETKRVRDYFSILSPTSTISEHLRRAPTFKRSHQLWVTYITMLSTTL